VGRSRGRMAARNSDKSRSLVASLLGMTGRALSSRAKRGICFSALQKQIPRRALLGMTGEVAALLGMTTTGRA
jgi:hypothetical protein